MKYEVKFTGQFKKDLKRAKKQGKDLDELFAVVDKLANGEKLVYELKGDILVLMLYRLGSHSELFKK